LGPSTFTLVLVEKRETNQLMSPIIGWDEIELIRALQRQGKRPTVGNIQYSLYECVSRGKIEWNRKCGDFNCGNGGGGKSDFCT
jgi:hypothetical protein